MAVAPLFVASMAVLKARLRMTGAAQADTLSIIDKAVEDVRVSFYDDVEGLGKSKVDALLAIAFVENATTLADLSRTRVNNLEVKWVRLHLLRRIPMLFMDGQAVIQEVWNEEPITRVSRRATEVEALRLETEIKDALAALLDEDNERGAVVATIFEPDVTPARPGASIKPLIISGD